jgi:hypothetical protein
MAASSLPVSAAWPKLTLPPLLLAMPWLSADSLKEGI